MHSMSELPPVSASVVDYQSFTVIGSAAKFPLVKAHGMSTSVSSAEDCVNVYL